MADNKKKPAKKKPSPLGQGLASLLGNDSPVSVTPQKKQTGGNKVRATRRPDTVNQNDSTIESIELPTTHLSVDQLKPGKFQPRRTFSKESLEELAQSIKEQGVLQPVIVRAQGKGYEIVAGERRWRAAQLANLHEVPVVVRDFDDRTTLELSILENVQRQDLSALEEAEGYQRLIDEFGHRQEDLAKIMGKSRPHIANTLRLLALPENVRIALELGQVSAGHGRALLNAENAGDLLAEVISKKLSVRQTEVLAKKPAKSGETSSSSGKSAKQSPTEDKDVDTLALEKTLADRLGLKVEIEGQGESGRLVVHYATLEQLDTVLAKLN